MPCKQVNDPNWILDVSKAHYGCRTTQLCRLSRYHSLSLHARQHTHFQPTPPPPTPLCLLTCLTHQTHSHPKHGVHVRKVSPATRLALTKPTHVSFDVGVPQQQHGHKAGTPATSTVLTHRRQLKPSTPQLSSTPVTVELRHAMPRQPLATCTPSTPPP